MVNALESLFIGILGSLAASVVFWLLTFKISKTDVLFSNVIEESPSAREEGRRRYRIRIANFGKRDLLEVSVKVKVIVSLSKKDATYLKVGNEGFFAVLPHRAKGRIMTNICTIYPGETALGEYQKAFYDESIREKAKNNDLSIGDIVDFYGDKVKIIVYIFGNDSVTGARCLFTKEYSASDIRRGIFKKIHVPKERSRAAATDMISQVDGSKEDADETAEG